MEVLKFTPKKDSSKTLGSSDYKRTSDGLKHIRITNDATVGPIADSYIYFVDASGHSDASKWIPQAACLPFECRALGSKPVCYVSDGAYHLRGSCGSWPCHLPVSYQPLQLVTVLY